MINTDEIIAAADIVAVIGREITLQRDGATWRGLCPFHQDSTPSMVVHPVKQIFKCFACGEGGDVIHYLMKRGRTFQQACAELTGQIQQTPDDIAAQQRQAREAAAVWRPIATTSVPQNFRHHTHGEPVAVWHYVNADGTTAGYVCRYEPAGGKKQILPFVYATDGTRQRWKFQGLQAPRPLYNLPTLLAAPSGATILVVEGEKAADAAMRLLDGIVVVSWQGGADAIAQTDWAPLAGRRVILWPDNDYSHTYGSKHAKAGQLKPFEEQPGNAAMLKISATLQAHGCALKWVRNPSGTPCGWDIADSRWSPDEARAYLAQNLIPVPTPAQYAEEMPPPPPLPEAPQGGERPFRVLGYSKDGEGTKYHFFGHASRMVISFSASQLAKNNFLQLAPLNWWEGENLAHAGKFKGELIANQLIQEAMDAGIFSDKNVRGRGAWVEPSGPVVIHTGDALVVNGLRTDLSAHRSRYIYERAEPLGIHTHDPLPPAEARRLIDLLQLLNWDREVNAYLLAGWCVVAPVCGALSWRPHIWLTGAAGTGKSWVFKNIVRRLLGDTAVAVQGETTEPGLRQMLGHDALPVVFDEAEGEDKRAQERMQQVLALMRAASADDGGIMAKGTTGGSARTYRIRSCFAFASIAYQVAQQSDRTRVTALGMRRAFDEGREARWAKLQAEYVALITDEFVNRLHARTAQLIPVLLDNARTFAAAAAAVIGEQRAGDQLGALLAGAYSLASNSRITYEAAVEWVAARDWNDERGHDKTRDELALLAYLLDQIITIETTHGRAERTLAELVAIAALRDTYSDITPEGAQNALKRCGIKVEGSMLVVSNSATWIAKRLEGKPWAKNHGRILQRIEGSEALATTRFGPGLTARAVAVPLALIFEE